MTYITSVCILTAKYEYNKQIIICNKMHEGNYLFIYLFRASGVAYGSS